MRKLFIIFYLTITVNLLGLAGNQCGAATYLGTGTWSYSLTNRQVSGNVNCGWTRNISGTAVITQTGNRVKAVDNYNGVTYTGTVSGTNYTISGSYPDNGGTMKVNISFTLVTSTSGSGTMTSRWTSGSAYCNGGADISLTKTGLHPLRTEIITTGDIDGSGQDDVITDFGPGHGIWIFMNNTTWEKLHKRSPEIITTGDIDGNGQDDIIIDFGSAGIYTFMNNTTWVKLHKRSPEIITTGDIDGSGQDDVIIDFGSAGIYIRMNNTTWVKLHKRSPEIITTGDIDGNGQDDVIIDFGSAGIYIRMNNTTWVKLHKRSPEIITTGDIDGNGQDDVIIDFGRAGIWIRMNNTTWVKQLN